jgi:hypothetical protein
MQSYLNRAGNPVSVGQWRSIDEHIRFDHVQDLWQPRGRSGERQCAARFVHRAAPSAQANTSPSGTSVASSAAPQQLVDVEGVLTGLASKNSQQLNWRTSIVDLMKLLDLDSSLNARKELATELHYTGDMNDSASMNIWLHKQVMQKLAENGGKVPDDLKA